MTWSRLLADVDHQGGLLVDPQADQVGVRADDAEEPLDPVPLEEVLVDDGAGEEVEPLAELRPRSGRWRS